MDSLEFARTYTYALCIDICLGAAEVRWLINDLNFHFFNIAPYFADCSHLEYAWGIRPGMLLRILKLIIDNIGENEHSLQNV